MSKERAAKVRQYYTTMLASARAIVGTKSIDANTVAGLEHAVEVLASIEAGAMTASEAAEYVNDQNFNALPGIEWARRAVKQAHPQTNPEKT